MGEKTSYLLNKKVKKKNQIPEYHAPSLKRYNKEDTKLINEKSLNPVGVLTGKIERSMKSDW